MSRLASSRNVQWSEEVATERVYIRAYNHVTLSSLRSGNVDEITKKMNENLFEENEKMYFGRNPKASYFMRETLIVQKVA